MRNVDHRLKRLERTRPRVPLCFRRILLAPGESEPDAKPDELLIIRRIVDHPRPRHEDADPAADAVGTRRDLS